MPTFKVYSVEDVNAGERFYMGAVELPFDASDDDVRDAVARLGDDDLPRDTPMHVSDNGDASGWHVMCNLGAGGIVRLEIEFAGLHNA